jgi:hypothetical protein
MKTAGLAPFLLAGILAGCGTAPPAIPVSLSDLPNCFESNYDAERGLFTIRNAVGNPASQQCLLTVGPRADASAPPRLRAGTYSVSLANGGGGGAGGTVQAMAGGGGGGGGGAGALEARTTVDLTEGVYKLTIGAGGPGGNACIRGPFAFGGGPGWAGSPSNIVRVATGEVVAGAPGADKYARPTRAQNEGLAGGTRDAHGGSGPGQASGGRGGYTMGTGAKVEASSGESRLATGRSGTGGAPGVVPRDDQRSGSGGGGGATSVGQGGTGGGEATGNRDISPARGSLGSGGGGGEGNTTGCEAGAQGGHGFIALRPM